MVLQIGSVLYLIQSCATFFRIYPQNMRWQLPSISQVEAWTSLHNLSFDGRLCLRPPALTFVAMPGFAKFVYILFFTLTRQILAGFLSIIPDQLICLVSTFGFHLHLCIMFVRLNFFLGSKTALSYPRLFTLPKHLKFLNLIQICHQSSSCWNLFSKCEDSLCAAAIS